MDALKYSVCLYLYITPTIYGYRTIKHNGADIILAHAGETIDIVCQNEVPLARCAFTHPNGTKIFMVLHQYFFPANRSIHRGDCSFTLLSVAKNDAGAWTCSGWLDLENRQYTDTTVLRVDSVTDTLDTDEPIISVTVFVCGSIIFLCIFAVLLYCKQIYHSRFYGKTWGDDESIENYMKGTDPSRIMIEDTKYFEL